LNYHEKRILSKLKKNNKGILKIKILRIWTWVKIMKFYWILINVFHLFLHVHWVYHSSQLIQEWINCFNKNQNNYWLKKNNKILLDKDILLLLDWCLIHLQKSHAKLFNHLHWLIMSLSLILEGALGNQIFLTWNIPQKMTYTLLKLKDVISRWNIFQFPHRIT